MKSRSLLLSLLLVVAACGPSVTPGDGDGDGGSNRPDGGPGQNGCTSGSTSISGVVTVPNGIDPVPGALVYIPRGTLEEFPEEVACEACQQISGAASVLAITASDGSFTLDRIPTPPGADSGDPVVVVVQKGRFRKVVEIPVAVWCGENEPAASNFRLPSKSDPGGYDRVPKIAVAAGDYDLMECVLLKLGLDRTAVEIFDGMNYGDWNGVPKLDTLLTDLAKMKTYNIIFVDCAHNTYEHLLQTDATVKANIEAYVAAGGRLYVTDWSYDYIEQITNFAPVIDFQPETSSGDPEALDGAALGDPHTDADPATAEVLDVGMREWLQAVEAASGDSILSGNNIQIEHMLGEWVMQKSVSTADNPGIGNATVWLRGDMTGTKYGFDEWGLPYPIETYEGVMPLTTTFDYQTCGRVLYSSYHTRGREFFGSTVDPPVDTTAFPAVCDANEGLSAQERVLEYLILHVADCIGPIE
jgi:hypothetical protein